jgi:WD40 repeat protein
MRGRRPSFAALALLAALAALLWAVWPVSSPAPARDGPRLVARRIATLSDGDAPARQVAFSADGRWLATTSAAGPVVLRRLPDLAVVRRLVHPGGATSVAFAPDRSWLATGGYDGVVRLWDLAGGRLLRRLDGAQGTIWTLDVSPDGRRVAAAGEDKIVHVWNADDGRPVLRLAGHERNVWEVRFSPDGRRLASGSFDRTARIWDAATGAPLRLLTEHRQAVVGLDWSRDGRLLATSGDDSTILVRRAADGAPLRRIVVGNHAYKPVFSPDGRFIAEAGRARSAAGTFLHGLTGLGGEADAVHLWRVSDGAMVAALKLPEDAISIAYSPDGRRLAAAGEDGKVVLWALIPL